MLPSARSYPWARHQLSHSSHLPAGQCPAAAAGVLPPSRPLRLPLQVVGMHFMNPVPIMQLVELARGMHTSQQTFEVTKSLAEHLGKQVGREG